MTQEEEAQEDLRKKLGDEAYDRYMSGQMNKEDQEIFDKLLRLEPHEFQWTDKVFLAARRDYLPDNLKEKYSGIIQEVLDFNSKKDGFEEDETTGSDGGNPPAVLTRSELEVKAKELGVTDEELKAAKTKADVQALIDSKESNSDQE